jgi:hypothetical protein
MGEPVLDDRDGDPDHLQTLHFELPIPTLCDKPH